MNGFDEGLWGRLAAMEVSPPGAALSFTARLAREEGWTPAFAARVMTEYRRFLYLAATGRHAVTPSDPVDAAWHLHLTYTRHYWGELCPHILGKPLHHMPTEGGGAEDTKHRHQYHDTLARYRAVFGEEPPADIWPCGAVVRRAPRGVRTAARLAAAGGASLLLAACSSFAGKNGPQVALIVIFAVVGLAILAAIALLAVLFTQQSGGRRGSGDSGSSCGGDGGSSSNWNGSSSNDSHGGSDGNSSNCGSSCGSSCGGGGCGGGGGD